MKKTIMTALAFSAIILSANAQEKRDLNKRERKGHYEGTYRHHGKDMLAKQLNFSDEQKKQVKLINEDLKKKMKELNSQENITVKEQRDRKQTLLKERKAKMDALLTAEQKTKLAQLKEEHQKKGQERFAKRMDKMKEKLNLSDAQMAQLKIQRESMHAKLKAIKENEQLGREQKEQQLMALKTEAKEQRKKIFTKDQLKKLEDMRKKYDERASKK